MTGMKPREWDYNEGNDVWCSLRSLDTATSHPAHEVNIVFDVAGILLLKNAHNVISIYQSFATNQADPSIPCSY